jgi:hypothetical protein
MATRKKPAAAKRGGKKMAKKLTLDEFRERLKAKRYAKAADARKAYARIKNDNDRKRAEVSVTRAFGAAA